MLLYPDGTEFCRGVTACTSKPLSPGERSNKLFIEITIEEHDFEAAVDTGGLYLILDPEVASDLSLTPDRSIGFDKIHIRGELVRGTLHRVDVQLVALAGMSAIANITAFVPAVSFDRWDLPSILGWFCCLERLRFAIDPLSERFYFSAID